MGFWSGLGKVLSIAGPIAATPFTGGTSLLGLAGVGAKVAPLVGAGLGALGSMSQGAAAGREHGAEQLRLQQDAAMKAALFNRQAPAARANAAVRGDTLANLQPASFSGSGRDLRMSGGLSPALLSAGTRQLGAAQSRQALLSQLGQGGANDPYTFNQAPYAAPQPGRLDTILQGAGLAGQLGAALGPSLADLLKSKQPAAQGQLNPVFQTKLPLF